MPSHLPFHLLWLVHGFAFVGLVLLCYTNIVEPKFCRITDWNFNTNQTKNTTSLTSR